MPWICGRSARILTHERARAGHRSLMEAALTLARRANLAASVTRAQEGWSAHGGARVASQVELSGDLPLIIEVVGATERIEAALPDLIALAATHGTITLTETRLWTPDEALRP
jgi:PII-like signaling protein